MLRVTQRISIPLREIQISAVRSQGPGGQNVNKVSSAIHLRFDIKASSLSSYTQHRLLACRDHRINKDGVIIIKAQQSRSQEQNKTLALERLSDLIRQVNRPHKVRKSTRPTKASVQKRLGRKIRHGRLKKLRGKPDHSDSG